MEGQIYCIVVYVLSTRNNRIVKITYDVALKSMHRKVKDKNAHKHLY